MAFSGTGGGWRRTALLGAESFTIGLLLLAPMDNSWDFASVAWRLFLAGYGSGLFNAPNTALAMSQAPAHLLATTGATTSLARQVEFAVGSASATVAWGLSSYRPDGMTGPLLLATACNGFLVVACYSFDPPSPRASVQPCRSSRGEAVTPIVVAFALVAAPER